MVLTCNEMKISIKMISFIVKNRLYSLVLFSFLLLDGVEGRKCTYNYDTGQVREFYCNAYEFCCGTLCCRARSIGFFQLWYFWLLIMLMLLLCSGGGWWVRYRRRYQMPPFGMPSTTPPALRSYSSGATGFQQTCPQPMSPPPPPYGAGYTTNNASYPVHNPGVYRPPQPPIQAHQMPPQFSTDQNFYGPTPPYMGPPPSYAAATAKPS